MKFVTERLKPIVKGKIGSREANLLIDSGADWTILTVPRYKTEVNSSGIKERKMLFTQAQYDSLIEKEYGTFVPDSEGKHIKTTVHGFGGTEVVCRLIILKSLSVGDCEFKNSFVLLDEEGSAKSHDVILGTSALRNFKITLDYKNRDVSLEPLGKEVAMNYVGIVAKDEDSIEGLVNIPSDIYLLD